MMWAPPVDREITLVAVPGTCEVPGLLDLHLVPDPIFTASPAGGGSAPSAPCAVFKASAHSCFKVLTPEAEKGQLHRDR